MSALRMSSLIPILLLIALSCRADYARDFMDIPPSAREAALGGGGVSSCKGTFAVFWNPAVLELQTDGVGFGISHRAILGLETYDFISTAYSLSQYGTIGIGWIRLGVGDIPLYPELPGSHEERLVNPHMRSDFTPTGYLDDVETALILSYSQAPVRYFRYYREKRMIALGVSMKIFSQRMGGMRGRGIGWDLGMMMILREMEGWNVRVGSMISDLFTSTIRWNNGAEDTIPADFRIGISGERQIGRWMTLTLLGAIKTRYSPILSLGAEIGINDILFLRAGLAGLEPSFGVGFKIRGLTVDYALQMKELSGSHLVSMRM
ncbi:TPA: hypothetical protein EYP37_02235 [Candidatus Poribacteria bacterium]|nr:hypothetical protein [Candidatus Poribacteria bacterium]